MGLETDRILRFLNGPMSRRRAFLLLGQTVGSTAAVALGLGRTSRMLGVDCLGE